MFSILFLSFCSKDNELDTTLNERSSGCGDFFVYKFNTSSDGALTVKGNLSVLDLDSSFKTFDLDTVSSNNLEVNFVQYDGKGINYCNDVIEGDEPKEVNTWNAYKGKVDIRIEKSEWEDKVIFIRLIDIELKSESNSLLKFPSVFFDEVHIGWYPG